VIVTAGKTNVSVYYYIVQDASNTSPGEPVTGLLFSDIETGGSASYARQGAARVDLTLITLASASAAHADGGFILVDDTNMPGVYRCDYADATFATGVDEVVLSIVVASGKNAVAAPIKVQILDVDLRDSVRGGMTALPNAAADAAGGLPISDAGGLNLDAMNTNVNDIETDTNELQGDWVNGGRLDLLLDAIPTTAMRGTDNAALASVLGALADAAAADDPTSADTVMQYVKQLVNVLVGTAGIANFDTAAAPANGVNLSEVIRAIYDDSNSLDGTKIPDTISLAAINAEVDTALDTAIPELGVAAPTATPTVRTALMLMYMALRNKLVVQTSGTDAIEIYNDAGTKIAAKTITDDGSDYTEDEMA